MSPKRPQSILTLRITLKDMKPPVWRVIHVSSDATFRDLHNYIQACMPWGDGHLHAFEKRESKNGIHTVWTIEDRKVAKKEGLEYIDEDTAEERKTLILDRLKKAGDSCIYLYDFGDGWEHKVTLEKISMPDKDADYPYCSKANGVCPVEDCGGPGGWDETLRILNDPKDPEHGEICEWLGIEPDDVFNLAEFEMSPEVATECMRDMD